MEIEVIISVWVSRTLLLSFVNVISNQGTFTKMYLKFRRLAAILMDIIFASYLLCINIGPGLLNFILCVSYLDKMTGKLTGMSLIRVCVDRLTDSFHVIKLAVEAQSLRQE